MLGYKEFVTNDGFGPTDKFGFAKEIWSQAWEFENDDSIYVTWNDLNVFKHDLKKFQT